MHTMILCVKTRDYSIMGTESTYALEIIELKKVKKERNNPLL